MALKFSNSLRSDRVNQIRTAVGGGGKIVIYKGSVPSDMTVPNPTDVLAVIACDATAFAPVSSNGVLTVTTPIEDASADAEGTAAFFRVTTSADAHVFQGTVTATGGGGDLQLSTTSIVANAKLQITSFVITEGNA